MSVKILNINLNYNYRDLSEADIGKLIILSKHIVNKSNTLLRKDNMQSNPLNAEDLSNIFNTSNSNVYKFLKRMYKNNIIKQIKNNNKNYYYINPLYISHPKLEITKELIENFKEDIISNISIFTKSVNYLHLNRGWSFLGTF